VEFAGETTVHALIALVFLTAGQYLTNAVFAMATIYALIAVASRSVRKSWMYAESAMVPIILQCAPVAMV
jgi:hypothetical protein